MPNSDETLARLSQLERNYMDLVRQFEALKDQQHATEQQRAELEALVKKAQEQLRGLDDANNPSR